MRWAALAAVALCAGCLLLVGCGSRTELAAAEEVPPPGRIDAGPRQDAGSLRDAGSFDAAVFDGGRPSCALEPIAEPQVVLTGTGEFDRPFVHGRAGGLDFGASRRLGDGTYSAQGRRALLSPTGQLSFVDAQIVGDNPMVGPAIFAAKSERLGACLSMRPGEAELRRWVGDDFDRVPPNTTVMGAACVALAGDDSRWFVSLAIGGPGTTTATLGTFEDLAGMPEDIYTIGGPGPIGEARAVAVQDGFAIAFAPDARGDVRFGRLTGPSLSVAATPGWSALAGIAPGIADWSSDVPALAMAHYAGDQLELRRIGSDGEALLRLPLGFSMQQDITPAVASGSFGILVATQNYGDIPDNGRVEVFQVAAEGVSLGEIGRAVAMRGRRLDVGGISAAAVGEHAVVHWTRTDGDATQTLAWVFGCR